MLDICTDFMNERWALKKKTIFLISRCNYFYFLHLTYWVAEI